MTNLKQLKNQGITLLELMIVIAVIAIAILAVAPLGQHWVASNQVNNAVNNFHHATLLAKSSALRNTNNMNMNNVAVSVCFYKDDHTLQVVSGNCAPTGAAANTNVIQIYSVAKSINILIDDEDFTCLSYDSAGILANTANCVANTTNFQIIKTSGGNIIDEIETDAI